MCNQMIEVKVVNLVLLGSALSDYELHGRFPFALSFNRARVMRSRMPPSSVNAFSNCRICWSKR